MPAIKRTVARLFSYKGKIFDRRQYAQRFAPRESRRNSRHQRRRTRRWAASASPPPIKCSQIFELSNLANSLKPKFSIGHVCVRLLTQQFDRRKARLGGLREPVGKIAWRRLLRGFFDHFLHAQSIAVCAWKPGRFWLEKTCDGRHSTRASKWWRATIIPTNNRG